MERPPERRRLMGINSPLFFVFYVCFFLLFQLVFRRRSQRLWLITLASIAFYATWSWTFVPILLATGFIDFYIARAIAASEAPRRRRTLLVASVAMNLGVLAFFKY